MGARKALSTAVVVCVLLGSAPLRADTVDSTLQLPDVETALHMDAAPFALPQASFEQWIRQSARVVHHYYGRFPERGGPHGQPQVIARRAASNRPSRPQHD